MQESSPFASSFVGAVIAVLGGRAAITSFDRGSSIRDYAHARSTATYFMKNGDTISASILKLQPLDEQDINLMNAQHAALVADNTSEFNSLVESTNTRNGERQSLLNQVKTFQVAFANAVDR